MEHPSNGAVSPLHNERAELARVGTDIRVVLTASQAVLALTA